MLTIRAMRHDDAEAWLELRRALWPEGSETDHRHEIDRFFDGRPPREPWSALIAVDSTGRALGFAELSIRPYAEGCRSNRVAYLEGWYVRPEVRRQGIGRALIGEAEAWGRTQGCTEFASDTEADNEAGLAAHRALGFIDTGLVHCFKRDLKRENG